MFGGHGVSLIFKCASTKKLIWFFHTGLKNKKQYNGRSKDALGLTIWSYHCIIITPIDAIPMFNVII